MKKYLMGIIAVVLAVGMSAFTSPKKTQKSNNELYWYMFDQSQGKVGVQIGEGLIDIDEYPETEPDHPGCPRGLNYNCARGYTETQIPGNVQTITPTDGLFK